MMNVLNVPSERCVQIDSINNPGNSTMRSYGTLQTSRIIFYPSFVPTGQKTNPSYI